MNQRLSTYLDLLRFLAAALVFFSHFGAARYGGGILWRLQPFGHYAVMLFFVLSGFVISYTAEKKEHTARDYALSRLARLYSVVLPALALTFVADSIGMAREPQYYPASDMDAPLLRLIAAGLFLSEFWYWKLSLFTNHAYWSLPYEFWYYVMFGAVFYFRDRTRVVLVAITALIAGTSILLLLPIWMLGVLTHRLAGSSTIDKRQAGLLFALSIFVMGAIFALENAGLVTFATTRFLPERFALTDYIFAIAVATNILAANRLELPIVRAAPYIKLAAGYTFSLYLFHVPLLQFFATFVPAQWTDYARGPVIFVATIAGVIALGLVTEQKKHVVKRAFAGGLLAMERHWQKYFESSGPTDTSTSATAFSPPDSRKH